MNIENRTMSQIIENAIEITDGSLPKLQEHFELMMALSVIAILPMVIVFFVMRKHIIKGVSLGGIKGN